VTLRARCVLPGVCCALLCFSAIAIGDDHDKAADSSRRSAQSGLNNEQQRAAGIAVAHPIAAKAPERIEALGMVLDATMLISDMGDAAVAAVAEHSASAELARLHALHAGGAGASLKMLEAAQADQAKAQAQAQIAAARFALRWGPVAALPIDARQKVIQASTSGRSLLVRADLPGRHTLGASPSKALLDVDGIQVPGRVLGILRETTELQSVGLLIEVSNPPGGLGPGARVPVAVLTAERTGLLLPRDALLYDENGAYVYKQLAKQSAADMARYAPVKVRLLLPYGEGWLVEGVDDDDEIVVHGAGVLWSLQGMSAQQPDDADDD
jgi:multidrug efflux pump subunit AcrA (membrane-fusion protein)